jgi:exonuclease-1
VKGVDITHEHALELMKECRKLGVDCITAMYEADSQLSFLTKIGLAEYIISEDSDLILFGCSKIIFKLQLDGRCLLFESSKLHLSLGCAPEKFSFEKFRRLCILSGCDYLDSPVGIGLAKAAKFMMMTEEDDMSKALVKIPSYLNMKKLTITDEYIRGFQKAEATFKHMFVYDPLKRQMLRLNPLTEDDNEEHCSNAGELLDAETAYQLALGNLNPKSLKRLDNFDPDRDVQQSSSKNAAKLQTNSIWKKGFTPSQTKSSTVHDQKSIKSFFQQPAKVVKQQLAEVQNIIQYENDVTSNVEVEDLVTSYCSVTEISSPPTAKRRNSELAESDEDQNNIAQITPSRNPFAKKQITDNSEYAKKMSMLKALSKDEATKIVEKIKPPDNDSHRVISRFFANKSYASFQSQKPIPDYSEEIERLKQIELKTADGQERFYRRREESHSIDDNFEESSSPESSESQEIDTPTMDEPSEMISIDLDVYQFKKTKQKQSSSISDIMLNPLISKPITAPKRRVGLSKPSKSKSSLMLASNSSTQSKLAQFGFQKKPSL